MSKLTLSAVKKGFGALDIIKGVDLEIEHGEFVVFVGPSGCGKSTLLRMIAGFEDITEGEIWIGDRFANPLPPRGRGVAMVFQSYALYPHMTVYDNVGYSLKLAKVDKQVRDTKIRNAARILQMEHLLDRKPGQLSGGQRQRVAIGRAIVREPDVFLFDEPLSNLDAALRVDMRSELAKLHQDLGATMIYVTHDQVEAMTMADRIVVLNSGVVQQVGTPLELYHRPANLFVAGFIGAPKMNFFDAKVVEKTAAATFVEGPDFDRVCLPLSSKSMSVGEPVTVGIRPHYLKPATAGQLQTEVELIERLGSETVATLKTRSGKRIIATLDGKADLQLRDRLTLNVVADEVLIFDRNGSAFPV